MPADHKLLSRDGLEFEFSALAIPLFDLADQRLYIFRRQVTAKVGLNATRILKEKYPKLPIIAQTAFAMAGEKESCLESGCDGYISKPIRLAELKQIIFSLLNAQTVTDDHR